MPDDALFGDGLIGGVPVSVLIVGSVIVLSLLATIVERICGWRKRSRD